MILLIFNCSFNDGSDYDIAVNVYFFLRSQLSFTAHLELIGNQF